MIRIFLISFLLSTPVFAQDRVPFDCTLPELSTLAECSRFSVQEGEPIMKWLACGGECMVESDEGGSTVRSITGDFVTRFDGLRFLHGYKPTFCLQTYLPFISDEGVFFIAPIKDGKPEEAQSLELPSTIIAPYQGFLTCDGRTLIYEYDTDESLIVTDIETGKSALPENMSENDYIYATSQDGRYLQTTDGSDVAVWDRLTGQRIETPAVFELDHIKFDLNADHMMIFPHDKPDIVNVYRLPEGEFIAALPMSSIGLFLDIESAGQNTKTTVYVENK